MNKEELEQAQAVIADDPAKDKAEELKPDVAELPKTKAPTDPTYFHTDTAGQ